jgi:cytosine/adenosine deaminase-related metal-dependent hydrolase
MQKEERSTMKAIINARIYDYHNYIDNGYIIFDDLIVEAGKMENYKKQSNIDEIDVRQSMVLPGLISGHTHLYSTFARGASLPFNPNNFLEILKQMWWKVDHFLDLDMIYYSALMGGIDQLKNGTTCLVDHHASYKVKGSLNQIYKALVKDLNMKALLAFETSDRFDVKKAIEENLDHIKNPKTKSQGLFGMHASLSLSDNTLKEIARVIENYPIHIHVGESLMDEEECVRRYGKRVVERLDDFGLINENALLVHCTHINDAEMDIIKKRNAVIAINPTSNLNNAVGISHVKKFMDKGIRVILGNDGLIQSQAMEYLNTYYLGHLKNQSSTAFGLNNILKIMKDTYAYVSQQLKLNLGQIKEGYEADLLVLPYKPYTKIDKDNCFGHIFFGLFPGFKPKDIFIGGKQVMENYQLTIENADWYKIANQQSEKLWNILKKEGENLEFKDEF